jgi:hypothetical protein
MSDALAEIPERLETLATALSEGLVNRHGEDAARALVEAGVVPADLPAYLAGFSAPPDMVLDQYLTQSLYSDGLTLVALACLKSNGDIAWERLEPLRGLLTRFASFYGSVNPRYQGFRTLPRERLGDFWNAYCGDAKWFGLLFEPTRFQSLRLCAYHDGPLPTPDAMAQLINGIHGPLWQQASRLAGVPEPVAAAFWGDIEQAVAGYLRRWRT